jgi:hypothetical protein
MGKVMWAPEYHIEAQALGLQRAALDAVLDGAPLLLVQVSEIIVGHTSLLPSKSCRHSLIRPESSSIWESEVRILPPFVSSTFLR